MTRRSGFTLIELSIVLVIIGLIIGGVLAGKDLIHAAEIRKTVQQVEQFDAAINAFRNKYNCLPGDCTKPSALGFTQNTAPLSTGLHIFPPVPGAGDGMISDDTGGGAGVEEAWWWLQNAGLVTNVSLGGTSGPIGENTIIPAVLQAMQSGPYLGMPMPYATWNVLYVNTATDIETGNLFFPNSGHYYLLSADIYWAGLPTVITPADAFAIDSKMDDGLPRSGRVLASGNDGLDATGNGGWPLPISDAAGNLGASDEGTPGDGAGNAYCVVSATPPVYNVQNTSLINGATNLVNPGISSLCVLGIKASF